MGEGGGERRAWESRRWKEKEKREEGEDLSKANYRLEGGERDRVLVE